MLKEGIIMNNMQRLCWRVAFTLMFAGIIVFGNFNGDAFARETNNGCSIIENDLDGDGTNEVTMENSLVKLTFKPSDGGACVSLIYKKTGKELTSSEGGVFEDLTSEEGGYGRAELVNAKYDYSIEERGPDRVKLHLWIEGKRAPLLWLEFHKTITIFKDKSVIRADYTIKNQAGSREPLSFSLRSHNVLLVNGEKNTYFIPATAGIQTREYDPQNPPAVRDAFFPDPARGWSGMIGADGTGLVCLMDYPYLKTLYDYFSPAPVGVNIEWFYGPVTVDCEKEFSTTYYLIPFSGLSFIDGASRDVVGSISSGDKYAKGETIPLKLGIHSVEGGDVDLNLRYRILPKEEWQSITNKQGVTLLAGETINLDVPFTPQGEGTMVVNCQLQQAGKTLVEMEKPVIVGAPTAVYKLEPIEEKKIAVAKEEANYFPFELSRAIVTPHIKWADPYHNGKIKALFLMSATEEREIIELAQRMDLDFRTATIADAPWNYLMGWARPPMSFSKGYKEVEPLLNDAYDAIVISGCMQSTPSWKKMDMDIAWDDFTKFTQEKILGMVSDGAGLVYVYPVGLSGKMKELSEQAKEIGQDHFLVAGIPFDVLPKFGKKDIKTVQYGKGRILFLNYTSLALTPSVDYYAVDFNCWEYYLSFLSKAMVWASGKEPSVLIKSMASSSTRTVLELDNGGKEREITAQLSVMDNKGGEENILARELSLKTGTNSLSFETPFLKTGAHFANFILKDKEGKVITWGSKAFNVESETSIARIILDKEIYEVGDKIKAKVKIINSGRKDENISLLLSWVDNFQRVVKKEEKALALAPSSTNEVETDFALDNSFSILNHVRCELKIGDKTVQVAREKFIIPHKEWDDYECMMFPPDSVAAFPGYVTLEHYRRLKDLGVTSLGAIWRSSHLGGLALECNLRIVPQSIHRFHLWADQLEGTKKTLIRPGCLSEPKNREQIKAGVQDKVKEVKRYSPFAYNFGDEMSLTSYITPVDICFSEYCLAGFREWLKKKYNRLEDLNEEWDTAFKNWEEVRPMTTKEVLGRANGNFSPWADHRSFMDSVFAGVLNLCKEAVAELDPRTPAGISGTQRPSAYGGYDWWKLMTACTYLQSYEGTGDQGEMQRSFSPGIFIAPWRGYRAGEFEFQYSLWYGLFHGNKGASLWHSPYFLNPDFTRTEFGDAVEKYIKNDLRKGVGKLMMNCERLNDGIAVHYSQSSIQAACILKTIQGYDTETEYASNLHSLLKLLEDIHLQYNFVAYEQIEEGELVKKGYKTLILPLSRAVSEKEAEQIRVFVAKGGVVIGDVQTAVMDGHCKQQKAGLLDDLFGIRREETKLTSRLSSLKFENHSVQAGGFDKIVPLSSSKATGSIGKYPAVIINACGKGKSVYLNFPFEYYMLGGRKDEDRSLFKDIVQKMAGVESKISIRDENGKDIPCEVVFFGNKENRYMGIMQDPVMAKGLNIEKAKINDAEACGTPAIIMLPDKVHVYDIRDGNCHGLTDKIKTKIIPGVAKLYGLLPYKVEEAILTLDNHTFNQGDVVMYKIEVKTSADKAGEHVVRLEVYDPEMKLNEPYTRNHLVKDGLFEGEIPLALNEAKGKWKIHIRDVTSGKEAVEKFAVK